MTSINETFVIEEINLLMAMQFSFCRSIERSNDEISQANEFIKKFGDEIKALEDQLWWIQFLRFCNTPCWRYRC